MLSWSGGSETGFFPARGVSTWPEAAPGGERTGEHALPVIPARRLERALCAIAHSDRLVHGARTQLLSPLDRAGGRVLFPRLRLVVVHGRGEMGMRPKAMPPPDGLLLARHTAVPLLELHHAVRAAHRFGEEAKWVVASPLLPGYTVSACTALQGCFLTSPRRDGSYTVT